MPEDLAPERSSKIINFIQRAIRPRGSFDQREVTAANLHNDVVRDRLALRQKKQILEAEQKLRKTEQRYGIAVEMVAGREIEARTDTLTGLPNEKAFNEDLQRTIESGEPYSVAGGDVDNFKAWNEVFGHRTGGDQALKAIKNLPAYIYRIHGDEMMIIFQNKSDEEIAQTLTNCGARLEEIGHLMFDKARVLTTEYPKPTTLSMSWGVTEGTATDTVHSVSQRADEALGKAKEEGKARFILVDQNGQRKNLGHERMAA